MEAIEKIKEVAAQAVPGAKIEIVNSTPAAQQPALLVDRDHIYAVAKFFKEDPRFQMDFCSCVTASIICRKLINPGSSRSCTICIQSRRSRGPSFSKCARHANSTSAACRR